MSLTDVFILAIFVLCTVKALITGTKLLNRNFNILMSACLIDLLVLLEVVWLQLRVREVRVLIFVVDFPMPEVRVFCLCRFPDFFEASKLYSC
jgi:hypothetical protein